MLLGMLSSDLCIFYPNLLVFYCLNVGRARRDRTASLPTSLDELGFFNQL
jgi:hypothetical protein